MRKMILGLITALVATMTVAFSSAPASALSDGWCWTYGNGVKTCAYLYWTRQPDGSGVKVEGFRITTPEGCSKLAGTPYKYGNSHIRNMNGVILKTWEWGDDSCSEYHDLAAAPKDKGSILWSWWTRVELDSGNDKEISLLVEVSPNGDTSIITKQLNDA